MRMSIELYLDANRIINNKLDLKKEVEVRLQMDEEYFWEAYEYNMLSNFTSDQILETITATPLDVIMKYIDVDDSSITFKYAEDSNILTYEIWFDFRVDSFMETVFKGE